MLKLEDEFLVRGSLFQIFITAIQNSSSQTFPLRIRVLSNGGELLGVKAANKCKYSPLIMLILGV